jgi:peptide deformylase
VSPTENVSVSLTDKVEMLLSQPVPLPIVAAGDPVLRRRAEPYDGSLPPDLFSALLTAMRETMLAAPGVGLAAPQIGLGVQLAVLEDSAALPAETARVRDRSPLPFRVLVNPTYTAVGDGVAAFYEGCLSVPGYQAVVERPSSIRLRAEDETGAAIDEIVSGWAARIVAHETDHLAGMLYLDKAFTRSLTNNENYLGRWATPTPLAARAELGF